MSRLPPQLKPYHQQHPRFNFNKIGRTAGK